ncbi:unnamed protein product [Protopolystoma xenopodis]|uniref:Uncharacterized protein n=1 Tax=Protopolystoma xenopodis TaxID=117903 RepID=A0A3S5B9X9_9PLAT|nr:unnamed protein product [Protopolystoma xenopodis]
MTVILTLLPVATFFSPRVLPASLLAPLSLRSTLFGVPFNPRFFSPLHASNAGSRGRGRGPGSASLSAHRPTLVSRHKPVLEIRLGVVGRPFHPFFYPLLKHTHTHTFTLTHNMVTFICYYGLDGVLFCCAWLYDLMRASFRSSIGDIDTSVNVYLLGLSNFQPSPINQPPMPRMDSIFNCIKWSHMLPTPRAHPRPILPTLVAPTRAVTLYPTDMEAHACTFVHTNFGQSCQLARVVGFPLFRLNFRQYLPLPESRSPAPRHWPCQFHSPICSSRWPLCLLVFSLLCLHVESTVASGVGLSVCSFVRLTSRLCIHASGCVYTDSPASFVRRSVCAGADRPSPLHGCLGVAELLNHQNVPIADALVTLASYPFERSRLPEAR